MGPGAATATKPAAPPAAGAPAKPAATKPAAAAAATTAEPKREEPQGQAKKSLVCYKCSQEVHFARELPEYKKLKSPAVGDDHADGRRKKPKKAKWAAPVVEAKSRSYRGLFGDMMADKIRLIRVKLAGKVAQALLDPGTSGCIIDYDLCKSFAGVTIDTAVPVRMEAAGPTTSSGVACIKVRWV